MDTVNENLGSVGLFNLFGLPPTVLLLIYIVIVVGAIGGIAFWVSRKNRFTSRTLKKWEQKLPDPEVLLELWPTLTPEQISQVAFLSQQHDWIGVYLPMCQQEKYYQAILLLWPYLPDVKAEEWLHRLAGDISNIDPGYSLAVTGLIKEIGDKRVMSYLLGDLLGNPQAVPTRICEALAVFGKDSGTALAFLYPKVDTNKKLLVLDALGLLAEYCPLEILNQAMKEPDLLLRKKVADVTGMVKPANPVGFLSPLLHDPEGKIRAAAVVALNKIGGEDVILTMQKMAKKDKDWQVITTCQGFLTRWQEEIQRNLSIDEAELWLK